VAADATVWPSKELTIGDEKNLGRWDARIRRFVFESELLSRLAFGVDQAPGAGGRQWATLWVLDLDREATGQNPPTLPPPPTAQAKPPVPWTPLVTMSRPADTLLVDQLNLVAGYADLRADRAREIVAQMTPQYAFWGSVVPLYRPRHQRTLELIHLVLRLAKYAEMNFKHTFAVRRPHELSPQVQPMIQTPAHGSFPSGHATEAFAVARVLLELVTEAGGGAGVPQLREQLMRQAARIAINRTVAGVHYPVDSLAGQLLGLSVAEYIISRFKASATTTLVDAWTFDAANTTELKGKDFSGIELLNENTGDRKEPPYAKKADATGNAVQSNVKGSKNLNWLWDRAKEEWW
jgi:membrane-associated phospholipid phosphatase